MIIVACCVFAGTAPAAIRHASPTGSAPGGGTCLQTNPCSLAGAVSGSAADGDEVVLVAGLYLLGDTSLSISKGLDVHGPGAPWLTKISSTASSAISLGNAGAKLRNVEIDHDPNATVTLRAIMLNSGTLERVIVRSEEGTAVDFFNGTVRNSILITRGSGRAALGINTSGANAYNLILRNVTAIAAGAVNSSAISASIGGGGLVAVDAKSVIARTALPGDNNHDVYASASGAGSTSIILLDHSNYNNVLSSGTSDGGTATITSTAANSNQTTLPTFVGPLAGDFHQALGSATVDAGATDGNSGASDVDGDARSIGGSADIGGDEYNPTAPPVPSISFSDGQPTNDNTPFIGGIAALNTTVTVFDGGVAAGTAVTDLFGNYSFTFPSAIGDGSHSITAAAVNASGVSSAQSAAKSLIVDATAPDVHVTHPGNGLLVGDNTPLIEFNVTELNPDTTMCSLDGGDSFACNSGDVLPPVSDGTHTLEVTHFDTLGASGSDSATFHIDTTPPAVTITSPPAGAVLAVSAPVVDFTIVDPNPFETRCSIDGGSFTACTAGQPLAALADGSHTLSVRHSDAVDNVATASTAFTIDTTAPTTKITAKPKRKTTKRRAKFKFSASEAGVRFECKLDRTAYKPCGPSYSKKVKRGKHKLWVRGVDLGNNTGGATLYRWTVK